MTSCSRLALPLLAAGLLWLSACGGGGGTDPVADDPGAPPQALSASQPGELTRYVQQRLRDGASQGWSSGHPLLDMAVPTLVVTTAEGAAPQRSAPLVQEAGVDEAALLQAHGAHLYTLQPQADAALRLQVYARVAPGSPLPVPALQPKRTLELSHEKGAAASAEGLYLSTDGRAIAVLSQSWEYADIPLDCPAEVCLAIAPPRWLSSSVVVQRVDTTDPAAASAGERLHIEGHLVDSRRIGDHLYLVTRHVPWLAAHNLPGGATAAEREAAIARVAAADVLPRLRRNGGAPQALVADTDCYLQPANASPAVEITTITVLDLRTPTLAPLSRCFVGGSEALYMTQHSLYLATTRYGYVAQQPTRLIYPGEIRTDIHKFALQDGTLAYRASGDVAGHLGWDLQRKSYRLSEHAGHLRVLSFTGSGGWAVPTDAGSGIAPSPATLTVLREDSTGQRLLPVATLPNPNRPAALGKPGEQVYAVRFVGDRGYVVTFLRTDPLYVLDLSNPNDPRTAGELEMPGWSDQLFPLEGGLLLGVGHDADARGFATGVQLTLFDVSDAAQPRLLARESLGHAGSSSALDHSRHGLDLFVRNGVARIALPVNLAPENGYQQGALWQHGLQKFEVDLAARSLHKRELVGTAGGGFGQALWLERSLQFDDELYYLGGGGLGVHAW